MVKRPVRCTDFRRPYRAMVARDITSSPNRARACRRARYRALTVAGLKRVAVGEQT
jgi:hypothetical protein